MEKKASLRAFNPVIPARDMDTCLDFYTTKLGFRKVFDDVGEGGGTPSYAGVWRDGLCVHLQAMVEGQGDGMPLIRVQVERVEDLYSEFIDSGAVADKGPLEPTAWGTKEFGIWDPNGAALVFYEDLTEIGGPPPDRP